VFVHQYLHLRMTPIVGGHDEPVIDLNEQARAPMKAAHDELKSRSRAVGSRGSADGCRAGVVER
jgi:hypothetical protein